LQRLDLRERQVLGGQHLRRCSGTVVDAKGAAR
jgi:hypothetical protein